MKDWKNHVWTRSAINLGQIFHDIACPGLIPKHTINERTLIIFQQVGVPGQFVRMLMIFAEPGRA